MVVYRGQEASMSQLAREKDVFFFFFLGADFDVPSKTKCQVVFMFYL